MSNLVVAYAVVQFDSNGVLQVPWSHHIDTRGVTVDTQGVTVDTDGTFYIPWAKGVFTAVPAVAVQAVWNGDPNVAVNDFSGSFPDEGTVNGGCRHATLVEINEYGCTVQTGTRSVNNRLAFCLIAFGEEEAPAELFESSGLNIGWGVFSADITSKNYTPAYDIPNPWVAVGFTETVGYDGGFSNGKYPEVPASYSTFSLNPPGPGFTNPPAVICSEIYAGTEKTWLDYSGMGKQNGFHQSGTLTPLDSNTIDGSNTPLDQNYLWIGRYDNTQVCLSTWGNLAWIKGEGQSGWRVPALRHVAIVTVGSDGSTRSVTPPYAYLLLQAAYGTGSNPECDVLRQSGIGADIQYLGNGVFRIPFASGLFNNPPAVLVSQVYGSTQNGQLLGIQNADLSQSEAGSDNAVVLSTSAEFCVIKVGSAGYGGAFRNFSLIAIGPAATYSPPQRPYTLDPPSGDTLTAPNWLAVGDCLTSPDGSHTLTYQTDGNLVVTTTADQRSVWSTASAGNVPSRAIMQPDGNFVVYRLDGAVEEAVWASNTMGWGTTSLMLQNDGALAMLASDGAIRWYSQPEGCGDTLSLGKTLLGSEYLVSNNGMFRLEFIADGSLRIVHVGDEESLWRIATGAPLDAQFAMLTADGDLALYKAWPATAANCAWSAGVAGHGGTRLVLHDDGSLAILDDGGNPVWVNLRIHGDTLEAGDYLQPGEYLSSADGSYNLVYNGHTGQLELFAAAGNRWLWGGPGQGWAAQAWRTYLQSDGNLVVYKNGPTKSPVVYTGSPVFGSAFYASNTTGLGGTRLVVRNDGSIVMLDATGTVVWTLPLKAGPDTLVAPNGLQPGSRLTSADSSHYAIYQPNGNLAVYRAADNRQIWATNTSGTGAGQVAMMENGNLVVWPPVIGGSSTAVWETHIPYTNPAALVMQNDGQLVIVDGAKRVAWTSGLVVTDPQPRPADLPPPSGATLSAPNWLALGECLTSADGSHTLTYQFDGNLVVATTADGRPVWSTASAGTVPSRAMMQADGNFVVYCLNGAAEQPLWSTASPTGTALLLHNDGSLTVQDASGSIIWNSAAQRGNTLAAGDHLIGGEGLTSANGAYRLTYQYDGDLVVTDKAGTLIWHTGTNGKTPPYRAQMQTDSNFCVYDGSGSQVTCVFASNTWNKGGIKLVMQNDGHLVMLDSSNAVVWTT